MKQRTQIRPPDILVTVLTLLILLSAMMLHGTDTAEAAEAAEAAAIDVTVSQQITMTADGKTPDMDVSDLTITNHSSTQILNVDCIQTADVGSGWSLAADSVDFAAMNADQKKFSLVAMEHDFSGGSLILADSQIKPSSSKTIKLSGKTGASSTSVSSLHVVDMVVTISVVDTGKPVLTVTSPAGTSAESATVSGKSTFLAEGTVYDDESGVKSVTVNGISVTPEEDGTWSQELALEEGKITEVTVSAEDYAGNLTSVIRYVRYMPLITVTYDANGGQFENGKTGNPVSYKVQRTEKEITAVSKTSNVSDDGVTADTITGYGNSRSDTEVITVPGASELTVTITYQTESASYDWVCIYDGSVTPSSTNYTRSVSGKLGGKTKTTSEFTVTGDTVQFYFKSDSSICNYYGYHASVVGTGTVSDIVPVQDEQEPVYTGMAFGGWYLNPECTAGSEFHLENLSSDITVYAKWVDTSAPAVEVYSPSSAIRTSPSLSAYAEYTVSGNVWDNTGVDNVAVSVNGNAAAVQEDGSWSCSITLPADTLSVITVTASDGSGNQSTETRYVCYDLSAPVLTVRQPASGDETNPDITEDALYTVSGTASDVSGVSVSVNGISAEVSSGGAWSAELKLEPRVTAAVTVTAVDGSGKTTAVTRYVYYDNEVVFAVYSESETENSLRFYKRTSVPEVGSTYDGRPVTAVYRGFINSTYTAASYLPWYNVRESVTQVTVVDEISPASTYCWFERMTNCSSFNLKNLDVSKVTRMRSMFYNAGYNAASFTISGMENWDVSNVDDMGYLFYGTGYSASAWNIGDISKWDTGNVVDASSMFQNAAYKASEFRLDLSKWNTSRFGLVSSMFAGAGYNAATWSIGNISGWDVSNAASFYRMFQYAGRIAASFDIGSLENWDTSGVSSMKQMFDGAATKVTAFTLDLSKWDTSSVTTMESAFHGIAPGGTFDIGNIGNWDTSSVKSMYQMFYGTCMRGSKFHVGDLSTKTVTRADGTSYTAWDTSEVTTMYQMFYYAGAADKTWNIGNISNWDTSSVTNMTSMFYNAGMSASYYLDLSGWDVSLVTAYERFNSGVENKITAPAFGS